MIQTEMETASDIVTQDLDSNCDTLRAELHQMAGSSLLITGGAGFLGYYLVQTITHWNRRSPDKRINVTVYDAMLRGAPEWLIRLQVEKALTLVSHNLANPLPGDMGSFQWIIHAASIASPIYYRRDPIGTMDGNINGLRNLLEYSLARKDSSEPVRGFLFFSSSEIYGDPDPVNIPTAEDYRGFVSCTGPRACYDEAKRYGETLCVNFHRQHGLPTRQARPFNNYGPGLKITDGRVLPDFCRDVLNGRDIVMLSDGKAMRTFCYVADAVCGYFKVLVNGRGGEGYNIGIETPEISMADLARKVAALGKSLFGYDGKVVTKISPDKDYLVDNPNRRCPVIAKSRTEVGFDPKVSLDEGLRRALIWYGGNRVAEDK